MAALSFFDERIDTKTLRLMLRNLHEPSNNNELVKGNLTEDMIENKQIQCFITKASLAFFEACNISTDFLQTDPEKWENNKSFQEEKHRVQQL